MISIYGLVDPRDGVVRYIGQSNHIPRRKWQHLREAQRAFPRSGSRKSEWLRELLDAGYEPEIVILETVPDGEANEAERRWIDRAGDPILNDPPCDYVRGGERRRGPRGPRRAVRPDAPAPLTPDDLRAFRESRGWSQADLAAALGRHYSTVSLWESGKRRIPPGLRLALERLRNGRPSHGTGWSGR